MDVHLRQLAAAQYDVVAAWQLRAVGATKEMLVHRVRQDGWRVVHPGVYALTQAPLTRRQLWIAATLTTPDSVLSHASAGAYWGIRPFDGDFETITRPGSGGPRRYDGLLVLRSKTLDGDTCVRDGIKVTTGARTVVDLAAHLDAKATKKAFREALRVKATTKEELRCSLVRHQQRRGTRLLSELATRYESLPYHRARSDAESRALEVLADAGVDPPRINATVAGEEPDLLWPHHRLIIEIDGPQYHRFADEDARKQHAWEAAGYTVRRLASDAVFDDPGKLVALAATTR